MRSKPVPQPTLLDPAMGTGPQRTAISAIDSDKISKNLKGNGFSPFNGKGQHVRRDFTQLHRDMKMSLQKKSELFRVLLDITPKVPLDLTADSTILQPEVLYSTQANEILAEVLLKLVERNSVPYTMIEKVCVNDQDGRKALLILDRKYLPIHTVDLQQFKANLKLRVTGKGDPCTVLRAIADAGDALIEAEDYSQSSLVGDLLECIAAHPDYNLLHRELTTDRQHGIILDSEYVVDRIQAEWDTFLKSKRTQSVGFAAVADYVPEVSESADRITKMMEQLTAMQEATMAAMTSGGYKGGFKGGYKGQKGKGSKGKGGKGGKGEKGTPRSPARYACNVCRRVGTHAVHYVSDCPIVQAGATSMNMTLQQNSGSQGEPGAAGACEPCPPDIDDSDSEDEMFGSCVPISDSDDDDDDVPDLVSDSDSSDDEDPVTMTGVDTESSDEEDPAPRSIRRWDPVLNGGSPPLPVFREPADYAEAIAGPDSSAWAAAVQVEVDSLPDLEVARLAMDNALCPPEVEADLRFPPRMRFTPRTPGGRSRMRFFPEGDRIVPPHLLGTRNTWTSGCDCPRGVMCPPHGPYELCPNGGHFVWGDKIPQPVSLDDECEVEVSCGCPQL